MTPTQPKTSDHKDLPNIESLWKRPIIIAANRAPVTFDTDDQGQIHASRGSGGLVTAMTGLARFVPTTWVACARTEEDAAWGEGKYDLSETDSLKIHFINPDDAAYEQYYNVISNPLLWFLQHSMWDVPRAPMIDLKTWQAWEHGYQAVNKQFAKAILKMLPALEEKPLVMLQDYHLYLAGRYMRELAGTRKKMPALMHFIHIPWPGANDWRILPPSMRQPIFDSLCAEDLIGFQTEEDGMNFIRSVEAFLPRASVDYKKRRVWYRNHTTHIRDFPISIDVDALKQTANSEEVKLNRDFIEGVLGDDQLILRIDRIEPSKNIIRGFQSFQELLELHPEHIGKVKFMAIMVPSRMDVKEYQDYLDECMVAAGRVNARYGTSIWEPIRLFVSEDYPRAVAALQIYDVLLVNSIADGMNLVAKEGPVVNQKNGVLILSDRTGANQQLSSGTLSISPCDVYSTAQALHQALVMSDHDKEVNAARLKWLVESEDIQHWTRKQLETVIQLGI